MKKRLHKPVTRMNINRKKFLQNLLYKSIFVLALILIIILLKKMNLSETNQALNIIKAGIEYEFKPIEDSKKLYHLAQDVIDNSLEKTIGVFTNYKPKFRAPIAGKIYRSFDQTIVFNGEKIRNNGVDIRVIDEGDPKAISSGVVINIYNIKNKGYFLDIKSDDIIITYGYLSKVNVKEGDMLEVGQKIGELGSSKDGYKYLRIEVEVDGRKVDPADYIEFPESI